MTRAELQALVATVRAAHPEVTIRLRRRLTSSGDFRLDLALPIQLEIHIASDGTDTARALTEEVEIMIEQASAATRESIRQLQVDRDDEPVEDELPAVSGRRKDHTPRARTLWAMLESLELPV